MGYGIGAGKYFVMSLLFNPLALYIYGGTILGFFDLLSWMLQGASLEGFLAYALSEYLPFTSLGEAFFQAIVGGIGTTASWFVSMIPRM